MTLRVSYLLILLCVVACADVCYFAKDNGVAANFALNLGSGLIGTAITVFLIDRVIERQEDQTRRKFALLALSRLTVPLSRHVAVWVNIHKAGLSSRVENPPQSFSELLDRGLLDSLPYFRGGEMAPIYPSATWSVYIASELGHFAAQVDAVIDKYVAFLSAEEVELFERVAGSSFLREFPKGSIATDKNRSSTQFMTYVEGSHVPEILPFALDYLRDLKKLCELHDSVLSARKLRIAESAWSDTVGSQYGAFRKTAEPVASTNVVQHMPEGPL